MKLIDQSHEILTPLNNEAVIEHIEQCGRVCYKSEDKIKPGSGEKFVSRLLHDYKHESVIEHFNISVRFITNRGVTHELVRHRMASFSQESTRYCNYSKEKFGKELTFIKPVWGDDSISYHNFRIVLGSIEKEYFNLINHGWTAQQAREVLPNALKTEIIVTTNLREWRHILKLRSAKAAHPQIRELMRNLLEDFNSKIPVFFSDIIENNA